MFHKVHKYIDRARHCTLYGGPVA